MKTWDGKFIGCEWDPSGDVLPEDVAPARAILERIFQHANSVLQRRESLDRMTFKLTNDEFAVIQRCYNLPDQPKTLLGVPITITAEKRAPA